MSSKTICVSLLMVLVGKRSAAEFDEAMEELYD